MVQLMFIYSVVIYILCINTENYVKPVRDPV